MIRVSNLRKEHLPESQEYRIVCDVDCPFSQSKQLWFSVPVQFSDWLTDDVYDAFLVAMLFPAMFYGHDIKVEGCVSEKLYDNVTHYVQPCERAFLPELHEVKVEVAGFANTVKTNHLVGTGFSAGIDAFSTLFDRFVNEDKPDYKLSALFFFNVGSHGGGTEKARRKFHTRYDFLLPCAQELGLPFVPMDSNLFDFYQYEWEYNAGMLCRATGILVFEKVLDKYYTAYDYSYWEITHLTKLDYGSVTDLCNEMMLGTETLEVISDGAQFRRSDKTQRLLDYPVMQRHLNVCVGDITTANNCSVCHKCKRTLLALEIFGRIDDFSEIFDKEKYYAQSYAYKCFTVLHRKSDIYANDNYELAKRMNYPMPSYLAAWLHESPHIIMAAIKKVAKWILRRNTSSRSPYPVQ